MWGDRVQILTGVRNFGKIEHAEVNINGFSVFVGNNNSGKTYMMQLIYGLRKYLRKNIHDFQSSRLEKIRDDVKNGRVLFDRTTAKEVELFLNEILAQEKEQIIYDTFNEHVPIKELYLKLLVDEEEQMEYLVWEAKDKEATLKEIEKNLYVEGKARKSLLDQLSPVFTDGSSISTILVENQRSGENNLTLYVTYAISIEENYQFHMVMREILKLILGEPEKMLFMPASRTGLLMLYKEFFAHKADEAVQVLTPDGAKSNVKMQNMGLTQPVYDFIRFMQTFTPETSLSEKMTELIDYIESHLIDGKLLLEQGNQVLYQDRHANRALPLYMSSSMVNELTPVLYALQSVVHPDYLIWDEIETSLHPQKQMELVRFLSRLRNSGISLIVSTHSDTMATKINNLCMLSYAGSLQGRQKELLQKTGLEEKDLLKEKLHIYQFTNMKNGKSDVSELEYNEFTGYEFTLFNDSVEKLFLETKAIME